MNEVTEYLLLLECPIHWKSYYEFKSTKKMGGGGSVGNGNCFNNK